MFGYLNFEAHPSQYSHPPMAVPFICLVLLFFLPNFSLTCPNPVKCGNVNISYPFFTNATPSGCRGNFLVACNGSSPIIQFEGVTYEVINISYPDKLVIVQDQALSRYFAHSTYGFLYNFTTPIRHFNRYREFSIPNSTSFLYLGREDYEFMAGNFHAIYNSSACRDYNFYWYESENQLSMDSPASCLIDKPAWFEWVMSFDENDGNFSLLSAGFSSQMKSHEHCFNCVLAYADCSSHGDGGYSSCQCKRTCSERKGKKSSTNAIIGIVAGVGAAMFIGCCLLFLYKRRKKQPQTTLSKFLSWSTTSKISSKKDAELGDSVYHTHVFSYDELEEATNGFDASRELGDGGFGTVYKGKLRDGRTVAVKRLYKNNYRRLELFMNEVEILSHLRHPNLVTLYGCTSRHSRELLLVYEFIPNGTLADHLHGPLASEEPLPWSVRMLISIETADALAYLHAVEPRQIIHRDVKTNNILLDSNFHVKVADFGLSRLFPLDATHVSTAPQGTPGYVDPEYHQCYQLSDKSDVYSFGVVLVELISSKPAVDVSRHRHEINLSNLAITKIQNGQIDQLVDPQLGYQSDAEIKRMINQTAELAFRCLQSDGEMRPCIKEALEVLKNIAGGGYKAEEELEVTKFRNVLPFSPDTVTERWSSRSTTPNTSRDRKSVV